jgi:sigma-B regulation protein RsbU (phosphoserine phosphatase)
LTLTKKAAGTLPTSMLPYEQIFALGNRLAKLQSYPEQVQVLVDFLQRHFNGEASIWLQNPPKMFLDLQQLKQIPDNILSVVEADQESDESRQIEFENERWVLIPLICGEEVIGRIIFKTTGIPAEEMLESLTLVGWVSGLAIYAALQHHLQDWQRKQLGLVQSVISQVSQITDLGTLTSRTTELVQKTFEYYYVAVFLIDDETQRLRFKASACLDECQRPEFEKGVHPGFSLGEHLIGYVAETGQEINVGDVTAEPRYKEIDSLQNTRSEIVLPLKIEDRIFGVFDVQSDQLQAFTQEDQLVLRALADNIAIAIENTRLIQEAQIRADQLTAVAEASRAITYLLDIDILLARIVNLIHERFGFPYVHLFTIDPVQGKINFRAGSGSRSTPYADSNISFDLDAKTGIIPWVAQHNQTRRVNDVEKEPIFVKPLFADSISGSEMTVPLNFGDEILGVLDIQSDHKDAFSQSDQQLIETFAGNITIAIRNARLYRSEKWRRQVAESLRDVAGLLSDNTALENVLDVILKELHKNLPCDVAGIWLFNHESEPDTPLEDRELHLAAYQTSSDYPSEKLGKLAFIPDTWVKNALIQEQPTIRQPDGSVGPIAKQFNMPEDYSAIAAPLHTGSEILGMLTLTHHEPWRYGLETQNITSAFASYAAIAIKNTRLFSLSQEQAWVSTILLQVAQAVQSKTSIDSLSSTIVRLTPMVSGVKGCALILRDESSDQFSLHAMYGIGEFEDEMLLSQPIPLQGASLLKALSISQEPSLVIDPEMELNLPEDITRGMEKDTLVMLPLMARGGLLGAFLLAYETKDANRENVLKIIDSESYRIIQGIIQQTALAVENIRLLETKQEDAYISTVLLQAAQATVSGSDLNDKLDSIVNIMPILVGIDSSVIYLWNEDDICFKTSHATIKDSSDDNDLIGMLYNLGDFPMLDAVLQNNRPMVFPFTETTLQPEDWDLALPDEGQIDLLPLLQSRYPLLMGFPLSVKDEVFGVLLAQDMNVSTSRERRFELLRGIAQQASLAIQNDMLNREMLDRQRIEREFQLAREIQQTFLPDQKPEIPGWDMDVRWETARQVGGDFYDYFLLPDGRLAIVIADVSDKGLAASLYMTVTRTLIRATALETPSTAATLERVNDLLLVDSQNGLFVTTFYGILDLQDGILKYTIAGHNPPLIIRNETGDVVAFEKGGIALGAMADIHLEENQVALGPKDCLVLYTDGVTEAFNIQDQMYGEERLKQVLKSLVGKSAHIVLETLEADLETFRDNAPLSDDTTTLAICRSPLLTDENGDIRPT